MATFYVCPFCGCHFTSILALRVHFTEVHTKHKFLCPCCDQEMNMDRFRFHLTMRAINSGPKLDDCHKALAFVASKYSVARLMKLFDLTSLEDVKMLLEKLHEMVKRKGLYDYTVCICNSRQLTQKTAQGNKA